MVFCSLKMQSEVKNESFLNDHLICMLIQKQIGKNTKVFASYVKKL